MIEMSNMFHEFVLTFSNRLSEEKQSDEQLKKIYQSLYEVASNYESILDPRADKFELESLRVTLGFWKHEHPWNEDIGENDSEDNANTGKTDQYEQPIKKDVDEWHKRKMKSLMSDMRYSVKKLISKVCSLYQRFRKEKDLSALLDECRKVVSNTNQARIILLNCTTNDLVVSCDMVLKMLDDLMQKIMERQSILEAHTFISLALED